MRVGIPKEIVTGERRVAATPTTVQRLIKRGAQVSVQAGAGEAASFLDAAYAEAGATIVPTAAELYAQSDVVFKVRPPASSASAGTHEADLLKEGAILIGFVYPATNKELVDRLAARKATVFGMDCVPRISRAQKLDALSAMANIAGYKAVVMAADHYGRFFGGQMTAAGKVKPAQVLIIGAGVAGLAAIGASRALGAVVKAFDTRPVVRDQVQSLGAQFLEFKFDETGEGEGGYAKQVSDAYLAAEQKMIAEHAKTSDIIVTTALIPGKGAPPLITPEAARSMAQGSVIVDLAAEQGGNCPLTEPDKIVVKDGVTFIGVTDLPSRMARLSSELYSACVVTLFEEFVKENATLKIDMEDEIQRGAIVLDKGTLTWPPPKKPAPPAPPPPPPKPVATTASAGHGHGHGHGGASGPMGWPMRLAMLAGVAILALIGLKGPPDLMQHVTVFLLACIVGWHVVWNVTPALHTPLMSVTNAISGIILVGGIVVGAGRPFGVETVLAGVAVLVATINVSGGFLVTQRMLKMFRK